MLAREVRRWVFSRLRGADRKRPRTVSAAGLGFLELPRLGIAALGRALDGPAGPRHRTKRLCRIHALRIEEEQSFRDLKSHRSGTDPYEDLSLVTIGRLLIPIRLGSLLRLLAP